jgi:hypothetical protein
MQIDFMLHHELPVALQYLVRTNFEFFGKRFSKEQQDLKRLRQADKRYQYIARNLGILVTAHQMVIVTRSLKDYRSASTLAALEMVRPINAKGSADHYDYEDFNVFATKSVLIIYENILGTPAYVVAACLLFFSNRCTAYHHAVKLVTGTLLHNNSRLYP